MPMLLAIDSFQAKVSPGTRRADNSFLREFRCGYTPNAHAAAWLVIIRDALRLAGRALWHALIFLRSSCLRLSPLEVARSALAGDTRAKSRRNWITRAERHLTKCGREKPSPRRIADRLFYADGVRATGTEKIMSLAEVAKATFYRHFESKDALVLAYLEYRDQALWDYFSQPTPPKDLREALTQFEQYANWPEVIGCPFLRIAAEFPDPAHPFHRLAIEHQDKIVDYLTALLEPFAIDRRPAAAILGVINGAFSTRMLYGTSRDITLLSSAEAVLKSFQSPRAQRRR